MGVVSGHDVSGQAASGLQWQRLSLLRAQMEANCAALAGRYPALAERVRTFVPPAEYVVALRGNQLILAQLDGTEARVRPCLLSAQAAHDTLLKIYPSGTCGEALLVAGIDQGWMWQLAYTMPAATPAAPGHRPPLYFLAREVEELWIALHLHDWRAMLADPRVRLMVGADAVEQLQRSLADHPQIPVPKVALTIGPPLWSNGNDLDSIIAVGRAPLQTQLQQLTARYPAIYGWATPEAVAAKLRGGQKLRVLGITSRFTTFLQYSMRDWLAAFARMGHETKLLIEDAAHEQLTTLCFARACVEFQPDVMLIIDHYRGEYAVLPPQIPCAMWVQDMLPNIFCEKAGAAQGPRDFCLGFGRLHLSGRYGYPARRYMTATMGLNEERFDQSPPTAAQLERFGCDVSYVSHASTPADVLLREKMDQQTDLGKRLLADVYERMVGHYQAGGAALSDWAIRPMIEQSMQALRISIPDADVRSLIGFFNQQISNAIFRHQTLGWLAEIGIDLRIYGRGWERHPTLSRFAKGVADNATDLGAIYRASKINIQVTPHGAVHQRLLDGLAAGGFFLLRHHLGDVVGRIYQELWDWCESNAIGSNEQLYERADARVHEMIAQINHMEGATASRREMTVFDVMNGHRDSDFMTSAASIWPEYDRVAFDTRAELEQKVRHFLADGAERARVAASMRQAVVERSSYTSISRRLLRFMADELGALQAVAA